MLKNITKKWPRGKKVEVLVTCGGFITFGWPNYVTGSSCGSKSDQEALSQLVDIANKKVDELLQEHLIQQLYSCTRYLTLGIDSYRKPQNVTSAPHVELVCLVDLETGCRWFTGKSYPMCGQEKTIVRNADLASHAIKTKDGTSVLLLGCHDLMIYSNRGQAVAGPWRRGVAREWKRLIKKEKPVMVLHHPHTTVKTSTWRSAWNELHKALPSVELSLGAGRYSHEDGGWEKRDNLEDVLAATKFGPTIDFIVRMRAAS